MSIATIEQYLIDTITGHFGTTLKAVQSLPADWDNDTFRRILRLAPGVFVVFGGGQRNRSEANNAQVVIDGRWGFVAVTAHASGELARRRGDSREIGAYEIVERISQLLDQHEVPGHGALEFEEIENMFTGDLEQQGAAIYGVQFTLPMIVAVDDAAGPTLDDFLTFDGKVDLAPTDGQIDAEDLVTLPQ